MKKFTIAASMLGLLSAPTVAEGHHAHSRHHYGRHARAHHHPLHLNAAARTDWQSSIPAGGDSFVANASYYGGGPRRFEPNSHTASGERFNQWDLTAAHRTLPMGTRLLVSHGDRSVVVRVNDRGPAAWTGRSLDLSRGAASAIGLISSGIGAVRVTVLGRG